MEEEVNQEKVSDAQIVEALKQQRVNQKELMYDRIPQENRKIIIKVLDAVIIVGVLIFAGIIMGAMTGIL